MENSTLSHDNEFIVVGAQMSKHRILDNEGEEIGSIGQQSEYPHFCVFSKDNKQLITNSDHFYNVITIGVSSSHLNSINIIEHEQSSLYKTIDEGMRGYCGLATSKYYILGHAYGYIKAIDTNGKCVCVCRHFIGSTISGITISDNEKILWVGSS
jgi:WD40 repeat protein